MLPPTDPAANTFLGIIGGLGSLAGADLFLKLVKSQPVLADQGRYHFLFEQHPFKDVAVPLTAHASMTSRKFYVFQVCQSFQARQVDAVLLPCFATHTFRDELQAELGIGLVDMMAGLREHVDRSPLQPTCLGVLTSDYVRQSKLFERYFGDRYTLVYPAAAAQEHLMDAVYGAQGIKAGHLEGPALEYVESASLDVMGQGAELVLPGMTELSLVSPSLQQRGVPCVDVNAVYADYATRSRTAAAPAPFKLGIVGGIGPAATVDFMGKVVKHTPAGRDQDHIKMVVEQNPQIPDRTAHLLHQDADPSVALYATCKRLESEGAHAIAIPCNTAHAFVERIEPHLTIPIINMLTETVAYIRRVHGAESPVGLLATAGTVASRVYHEAADAVGLQLIVPDPAHQDLVTSAIYGEQGVKAGWTEGVCVDQLMTAAEHLVRRGARVVILGCTELPLIAAHAPAVALAGTTVAFVDPTTILAIRCVALAKPAMQPASA